MVKPNHSLHAYVEEGVEPGHPALAHLSDPIKVQNK